ncbi:MAG: hypothetical protein ACE5HI_07455 [bacterium]
MSKKWYVSKTIWVNGLMLVGMLLNQFAGLGLPLEQNAEWVVSVMVLVNVALRAITHEPVEW